MRSLADLLSAILRLFQQWARLLTDLPAWEKTVQAQPARLREVTGFGSNPGNLRMFAYVPDQLARSPALVVVLHGCLQTAAGYDYGAGWSTLADRYGFALLVPEQQTANNPQRCFNWFQREDSERDHGEALSIRNMVEHMIQTHGIDHSRVFVTGLSAGGAMTSVMLATYPDVFAGGAIIAGIPYRCATGVPEALRCMFQGQVRSAREWGDLVRAASTHQGPWPKVSVWHGTSDLTVSAVNATEIIKQWTDVHGLPASPTRQEIVDGHPRRVWENAAGEEVLEDYLIAGMDHGTPIAINTRRAAPWRCWTVSARCGHCLQLSHRKVLGCDRERACTDLAAWLRAKTRTGFGGRCGNVASAASDGCQASASSPWCAEWGPSAIAVLSRLPFLAADRARGPGGA